MDADVAFSGLGASLGIVEHLLSLAVLVHRDRHHFLLIVAVTAHHIAALHELNGFISDRIHSLS